MPNDSAVARDTPEAVRGRILILSLALLGALVVLPELVPFDRASFAAADLTLSRMPPLGFQGSDPRFPLGTDEQGRDVLSMTVHSARTSVVIALAATLLGAAVGVVLGLIASRDRGLAPRFVVGAAELQLAFPALVAALLMDVACAMALGEAARAAARLWIVGGAIALAAWPEFALAIRAISRDVWRQDFIASAVSMGQSDRRIVVCHIWPGVRGAASVLAVTAFARAITIEATLGFLGVGLPPSEPSLGSMIRTGQSGFLSGSWWTAGVPLATLLTLCVLAGFVADRLRKSHDPHG